MTKLPKSRQSDIVVQALDKELLIYDLKTHKVYQLNETSMIIFQACAEGQTFEDLKRRHKFTDDLIYFALDNFYGMNLIDSDYQTKFDSIPRRALIKKIGLATAAALPLVAAISAPAAAVATSGCLNPGGAPRDTQVGATRLNQSNDTNTNQNAIAPFLTAQCCSNMYQGFVSQGCSNGIGATCTATAKCL